MNFSKISFVLDGREYRLEEWMLFSFKLGVFMNKYTRQNNKAFNLYFSLPNSLTVSYFLIHGIFDSHMEQAISKEMITKRFQELEPGAIIYYLDGEQWKRCSVKEVIKGYTGLSSWHIKIVNHKNVTDFIPLSKWETNIVIANRTVDKIMKARVVEDVRKIAGPLEKIYSSLKINRRETLNVPSVYVIGNRTEFDKYLDLIPMMYGRTQFTHKDILIDGTTSTFKNIQWLMKNDENQYHLSKVDWLLLIGASKALLRMNDFSGSGKIILDDYFENPEISELLRDSIEQDIIQNRKNIITQSIMEQLKEQQINIPKGVELFAWE